MSDRRSRFYLRPAIVAIALFGLHCGESDEASTVILTKDEAAKKKATTTSPEAGTTEDGGSKEGGYTMSHRQDLEDGPFDEFDDGAGEDEVNGDESRDELRDELRDDAQLENLGQPFPHLPILPTPVTPERTTDQAR